MAKEGKKKYELKKGKRFQFDLSKNSLRTFDLVKDIDEAQIATSTIKGINDIKKTVSHQTNLPSEPSKEAGCPQQPVDQNTSNDSENKVSGSNKWMWVIGILLIAAIIVLLCVRGCSASNDNVVTPEPSVEAVEVSEVPEEEVTTEQPISEGVAVSSRTDAEAHESETKESITGPTTVSTQTPSEATSTPATTPTVSAIPAAKVSSDIEAEAMNVIRGDYGVGQERKDKLGTQYRPIQNRVNQLKREGAF